MIPEARLCQECERVTKSLTCPLCNRDTIRHPEIEEDHPRYCLHCADEFPDSELRVITFEHNPYEQCDDGSMNCICVKCLANEV